VWTAFDAAGFVALAWIAAATTFLIPVCCIWLGEPGRPLSKNPDKNAAMRYSALLINLLSGVCMKKGSKGLNRFQTVGILTAVTLATIVAGVYQIHGQGRPPQAGAPGLSALEAQHQRLLPLFELAGVVFTDADETRGRFVVGVVDRDIAPTVRAWATALGVPFQLVDVVETQPIVQVQTLQDKNRPVVGGLQIRFSQYLCSMSFNARNSNGVLGYVTASHCSNTQGAADGTLYYQPLNQVSGEYIGQEIADPAFFRCARGKKCRYSDANFSAGDSAVTFTLGAIAETSAPNNGSLDIVGHFNITGEEPAALGQTVNKVGRTTGWTQGKVTNTCVNTGVSGSNIVLLCQNFVDAGVGAGDSGSPVFRIVSGDSIMLQGTLWGGNSSGTLFVYSPIANIESELGALTTN